MINIGNLAVAILEDKVSKLIGDGAIKELRQPFNEADLQRRIIEAAKKAEQAWIEQYPDKEICTVVQQMPLADLPVITQAIRRIYEHSSAIVTEEIVTGQLIGLTGHRFEPEQIERAVTAYLEFLRRELICIDALRDQLVSLASLETSHNTGQIVEELKGIKQILETVTNPRPEEKKSPSPINMTANQIKKIDITKPHLNILNMGHIDHGKTTVLSAITKILASRGLAEFYSPNDINKAREEQERGITIKLAPITYETQNKHLTHLDCPGHRDYIKAVYFGTLETDIGLLIVAAGDGPMPQTREHLLIAKEGSIKRIIVFINKTDMCDDPDIIDVITLEVSDLLSRYDFSQERVTFLKGSALAALECGCGRETCPACNSILRIIDILDQEPVSERAINKPFRMWVQDVWRILGRGTVVGGVVSQGKLKVGDKVAVLPIKYEISNGVQFKISGTDATSVTDITIVNSYDHINVAKAGSHIGCLLRGIEQDMVHRGQMMALPNSIGVYQNFQTNLYLIEKEHGGRHKPIFSGVEFSFHIGTAVITGKLTLPAGFEMAFPGEHIYNAEVRLFSEVALEKGMTFIARHSGITVGGGVITNLLEVGH